MSVEAVSDAVSIQKIHSNEKKMNIEILLHQLKLFYSDFGERDMAGLSEFYMPTAEFVDPIHRVKGLPELANYFENSIKSINYCRFEFVDQCVQGNQGSLRWVMHYSHSKIKGGEKLELEGMSFFRFEDKIAFHQDYYDMGQMIYEHVPVLGSVTRFIKGKAAS